MSEVQSTFSYDAETGVITRKNKIVGSKNGMGYLQVNFKNKSYKIHRLAWLLYYQEDPGSYYIDHIDGDKTNNRIFNLRKCTHQQNLCNTKQKKRKSSTGFRGVYKLPSGRFRAVYGHNGKNIHIGVYDTPEEAHHHYLIETKKVKGEYQFDRYDP